MTNTGGTPAGWYHAPGDAEGTQRYWDGSQWIGEPQAAQPGAAPGVDSDATVSYTPAPPAATPPVPPPGGYGAPNFGAPTATPPNYAPPSSAPGGFGASETPYAGAGAPPPGYVAYGADSAQGQLGEGWQRVVARLVDGLIWFVISLVFGLIGGGSSLLIGGSGDVSFGLLFIATLLGTIAVVAYEVLMTTKTGSTLGKKIFGLRIVDADGSRPDEKTMLMRMSTYIAASILGVIPILGILAGLANFIIVLVSLVFLFTDSRRQAIWDKIAKTTVVV